MQKTHSVIAKSGPKIVHGVSKKIGGNYYVRLALGFGDRSSPGLWNDVTTMLLQGLSQRSPNIAE